MSGVSKAARFVARRSRALAALYLLAIAMAFAAFAAYGFWAPRTIDQGVAILIRSLLYDRTFDVVSDARRDVERGDLESAETRLTRFIAANQSVQRSQLMTRALVESHEVLAAVLVTRGKLGRARNVLRDLTDLVPLHYRAWLLRGRLESELGDLSAATESLSRSFRLSLNNVEVVEAYLKVLAETSDFERILWVQDQYLRADVRARPFAGVKLGVPRNRWQVFALTRAGIPIEHARYFRMFEVRQLERGVDRWLSVPGDAFRDWPGESSRLAVQARFEHVLRDLEVSAVRFRDTEGAWTTLELDPAAVRYYHVPHSSSRYFVEFEVDLDPSQITDFEFRYSCPERSLSSTALSIIDKARANLSVGGERS